MSDDGGDVLLRFSGRGEAPGGDHAADPGAPADARLRAFIGRIDLIDQEIADARERRKNVFTAAKLEGFCAKALGRLVAYLRRPKDERESDDAIFETYRRAIERAAQPSFLAQMHAELADADDAAAVLRGVPRVRFAIDSGAPLRAAAEHLSDRGA